MLFTTLEISVMHRLVRGMTHEEIAQQLKISIAEVQACNDSIIAKVGYENPTLDDFRKLCPEIFE